MSVVKDVDLEAMPMSIFINDDDNDEAGDTQSQSKRATLK